MLKKRFFNLFNTGKDAIIVEEVPFASTDNGAIVDAEEVNDLNKDYSMEEILTFYMEQTRCLKKELEASKKEISLLNNKISDKEDLINEKEIENAALKVSNTSMKRKITSLEKKVTRLTAVEKVWNETISKIVISTSGEPQDCNQDKDSYDIPFYPNGNFEYNVED